MIVRARVVVTMDGPPIENGAVVVAADRIVDVGAFPQISARHAGEKIIDLGEQALLPGLINAHCHLDYTCLRGKIPLPKSFTDWIRAINAEKAKLSPGQFLSSIKEGFAEAKKFGTTTIANLTAFPQLIAKIPASIRTWWFAELIDVREPERASAMVDRAVEALKTAKNWGLAPHALYTASADLYRRCEEIARRENVWLTTHLAESDEEKWMFRDASGPLYDFLTEIGRPTNDCGHETPLGHFRKIVRDSSTSVGMTERWMLVHLNQLTDSDFDLLQRSKMKFHVVHCPRSHDYFGHAPFQFEKLRRLGLNICLGTDSLASNDDLSLFAEMRQFQRDFPNVSPDEILRMVTVNGARALREQDGLGRICRGGHADLVAIPSNGGDVFEEIVAFRGEPWMMLGGAIQQSPRVG